MGLTMIRETEEESLFKKVKSKRVFEDIADQIRELIYAGVLKPGDKLPPERELAVQFGAGRMVVREALRVLEQAGFIYIKQGIEGGTFVKTADTKVVTESFSNLIKLGNVSIAQLMEARIAFEELVLKFAMEKIDEHDLELLERNISDTEDLLMQRIRLRRENLNFHLLIARAAKNPLFEMIIQSVLDIVLGYLTKFHPDEQYLRNNLESHRTIYSALKTKDFERARHCLREHLDIVSVKLSELSQTTIQESSEDVVMKIV
jgi:GntR family transcriptional repressor for pyruvate dehydrogenase complex